MKTTEQILKTAKKKYTEAIRGRDYQLELIENSFDLTEEEIENLYIRKNIFTTEIALLEDVFGTKLLQAEQ